MTSSNTPWATASSSLAWSWSRSLPEEKEEKTEVEMSLYKPLVKRPHLLKMSGHPGEMVFNPAIRQFVLERQRVNDQLHRLVTETGMPIILENGQRRYGPPRDHIGPPPLKGSEVFVGRIPRDAFELELVPVFSNVGRIYEMRIMVDFDGLNRGYGFVKYYNPVDADNAILCLNNYELRPGKRISVVTSVDNCRLYIWGIPKYKTRDELFDEINRITEGVEGVIVYCDPVDRTKNRGYAFIEYNSHGSAAVARRRMFHSKIKMFGVNVRVNWAEPEPDIFTLFVNNLSEVTTAESLERLFNLHSESGVRRVIIYDTIAYITFHTPVQADQSRKALNGCLIDGSQIKLSFARQKTSGKSFVLSKMDPWHNAPSNDQHFSNHQGEGYHAEDHPPVPIQNQNFNSGYGNPYYTGPTPFLAPSGFGQYQDCNNTMRVEQLPTNQVEHFRGTSAPGFFLTSSRL